MDKLNNILTHFPFEPTADQHRFAELMVKFLSIRSEEGCFILRGYAGTGKTTSISALVKALPKFNFRTVLLAPTGRAAKVISQYSKKKAFTIHKRIYRKKQSVGVDLSFELAPNLAENTIFIVDEASMIADLMDYRGSSLLRDLIKHVFQPGPGGINKNCKLILVGDTAQLPPVGTTESVALSGDYMKSNFHLDIIETELKTVVRQGEKSGILANATLLRKIISSEQTGFPKLITKNFKDIFRMPGARLAEGLEYAYKKYGVENSLVICRSNKSANLFNNHIRSQLLYREEELTGGDNIMIVKNNYHWLPENQETDFIANGDMAKIIRVRKEEERYGLRFAEVLLELMDYPEAGTLTCKVILDTLSADTPNLSIEANKRLYEGVLSDYEHVKTKALRQQYIKEDPYYNALQIKFSYAVTCHKAQGGQWDAVFVDQGYLTDEMVDTGFMRWLYTALTRSKSELFLVNFSDSFFKDKVLEF